MKVIQNLPYVKTRQKRIRGFHIAGRDGNLHATKAADTFKAIEGTGESARWVSKTNPTNGKRGVPKGKDFLSVDIRPNDTDVEVENLCANERDRGGERRKNIGVSGKQNRTVKFQTATGIENEIERENEDITNMNHNGIGTRYETDHIQYNGGDEEKNDNITYKSIESQKYQAPFSRIYSNKQTSGKEQELSCTSNGGGMTTGTTNQSEVIIDLRKELDCSEYQEAEGAIQKTINSLNHGAEEQERE